MHHPVPLAKELATLQNLSEGRLILGAAVGRMAAEFAALGVSFRERERRMDEGIAMMRAVRNEAPVSFRCAASRQSSRTCACCRSRSIPIPICDRSGDGKRDDALGAQLAAYNEARVGRILVEPAERALDDWLRAVEWSRVRQREVNHEIGDDPEVWPASGVDMDRV